jgi:hypothetical protein
MSPSSLLRAARVPSLLLGCWLAGCSSGGGGHSFFASSATTTAPGAVTSSSNTAPVASGSSAPVVTPAPANLATGASLVLDASGNGPFFDQPFPIDSRVTSTGALDWTGMPNPMGAGFLGSMIGLAGTDTVGAAPTGTIYFRFDGPINAPTDDPLQSVAPTSPILLVDIDPTSPERLTRREFHVAVTTAADSVRPANLLQVRSVPGLGLRFNTTYAVIVLRSLGAPGATFLGQSQAMTDLLAGNTPAGALGPALQKAYAPLLPGLHDLGIAAQDVAAATVFTTNDPTDLLIRQVANEDAQAPLAPNNPITVRNAYPTFTALQGDFLVPQYQQGSAPFLIGGGRQVVDAQGMPVAQGTADAPFQVSVPQGKMPAAGFPLYFYVHGTGGSCSEAIDRGPETVLDVPSPPGTGPAAWIAPNGWATSCMAGPFSPDRIGAAALQGYAAYNVFNPVAMRDNFIQMVLEEVRFRKLLLNLRIDPSLCPGTDASASPDGKVRFDPANVVVAGQSLGSYVAGMLASTLGGWKGSVLSGAGGSWIEFLFGPTVPVNVETIVETLALPSGEKLDRFHPFITVTELAIGPSDNTHYLSHVLRDPLPGHVPPHVLVVDGFKDLQVATCLQRCLLLGLGLDFGGADPATSVDEEDSVVIPWSGRSMLSFPVQSNFTLASGDTRTAVFVRWAQDPVSGDGHYVAFQDAGARLQIVDFLADLSAGRAPTVQ